MAIRQKVLILSARKDKKFLDRLQPRLGSLAGAGNLICWDDNKIRPGARWRKDLAELLENSKVVVLLISGHFFEATLGRKGRLLALLQDAETRGLRLRWILLSHCYYDLTDLDETLALNDLDQPLDTLSPRKEDAVFERIGGRILSAMQNGGEIQPAGEKMKPPDSAPARVNDLTTPPERAPQVGRITAFIETQRTAAHRLHLLEARLWLLGLFLLLAGLAAFFFKNSVVLLSIIAGGGIIAVAFARVAASKIRVLGQTIISLRYVRAGFLDDTIPTRQIAALEKRADQLLAKL